MLDEAPVAISPHADDRLMRIEEVEGMVSMARPTIYRKIRSKEFPIPLDIGGGSRWLASEVQAWIRARPRKTL